MFLMIRLQPKSTLTHPLFPDTTLFRSRPGTGGPHLPAALGRTAERRPPVSSARQQILASVRRSLRRAEPSAETRAELEQRLAAPTANLIPQRAQLPHAEQLDLMEAMLQELKATVVRLPGEAAVPQAVAEYLKSENLPPTLRLAPRDDLSHLPWDSAPLLEVEEGIAEADDATSRSEEHTS